MANGEHLINRGYLEEFYDVLTSISRPDITSADLSSMLVMDLERTGKLFPLSMRSP